MSWYKLYKNRSWKNEISINLNRIAYIEHWKEMDKICIYVAIPKKFIVGFKLKGFWLSKKKDDKEYDYFSNLTELEKKK
jgi:hypothetical protein